MERPLTGNIRPDRAPLDLTAYEAVGGYRALKKALKEMSPAETIAVVKDSGLRGRGGAGFPTGLKWSFVPTGDQAPRPKYLLCNADEMEPGTFKDRLLLESQPHQLIEGMILASYAMGADKAYIFLRWAYHEAADILRRSLVEAREAGYLGKNILGSGFDCELLVHTSAGRYICGEETALISSLEGKRANPRAKPPFPPMAGFLGLPTIVNNVETLSFVPHIVANGAEWFRGLGLTEDAGTKIFGVSGPVKNPGLWELPLGTPIREILEGHAGGMLDGRAFRALLPGGASTDFLVAEHLDLPMDFASIEKAGSRLGTGTMIVIDDRTCPVGAVLNLTRFFAQESCGWCTPCREGLSWCQETLKAIEAGEGRMEDLDLLEQHGRILAQGYSFCALATGAAEPIKSGLKHFRAEFERHVSEHRCPWR